MIRRSSRSGFTLVELLVTICVIGILVAVSFPAYSAGIKHAHCYACASNMHCLGIAFLSYSLDNDGLLPGRVEGTGADKWPTLLLPYIGDDRSVYIDPGDPTAAKIATTDLISNTSNNSSFIFNGFNDLGAYGNSSVTVNLANLPVSSTLILLGQQVTGSTQFYMDFVEGNEDDVLNKTAYFGGSNYVFADGSERFLTTANYSDTMWLVDQSYSIPAPPPGH